MARLDKDLLPISNAPQPCVILDDKSDDSISTLDFGKLIPSAFCLWTPCGTFWYRTQQLCGTSLCQLSIALTSCQQSVAN